MNGRGLGTPELSSPVTKAVVLARGLGSRMRAESEASLSPDQAAAAASGAKAMMPLGDRPFLDHVITRLADAGLVDVCLVIGPEHHAVRRYYGAQSRERVRVSFAEQEEPLGTADAVAAAEEFVADERFVVVNGDNLYPTSALRALVGTPGMATAGFPPRVLVRGTNIPAERIAAFALLRPDADGFLLDVVEKPTTAQAAELGSGALVSMNCWLFGPEIVDACQAVEPSLRGEYELVDGVRRLLAAGHPCRIVPATEGVWDLSTRSDVASVARALQDSEVRL